MTDRMKALESCVARLHQGWMPVVEVHNPDITLEEVYGFRTPHWCKRNDYNGQPLTRFGPRPVPMTADEITVIQEANETII